MQQCDTDEIEILILLDVSQDKLEHVVHADNFKLNCTPAINLFEKQADRIHLKQQNVEHHLVVDKTKPNDFEVFRILEVMGFGSDMQSEQKFRPFYSNYPLYNLMTFLDCFHSPITAWRMYSPFDRLPMDK